VFAETAGGYHPHNCLIVLIISDIERQTIWQPYKVGLLLPAKVQKKTQTKKYFRQ
jgi:hypothetical protein